MFKFNPLFLFIVFTICETAYTQISPGELMCNQTNYETYIKNRRLTRQLINQTGEGCQLEGINLSGRDLTGTYLNVANLRNAYLVGAILTNATLEDADLSGADLRGAVIMNTNLSGIITDENTKRYDLSSF